MSQKTRISYKDKKFVSSETYTLLLARTDLQTKRLRTCKRKKDNRDFELRRADTGN
jgi:hypothetical protein